MFLHIGNGKTVRKKDIIGIFDMDTATSSTISRKTLHFYEKNKKVFYDDSDIPRTFILLGNRKDTEIRLSHISSKGLWQRVETPLTTLDEDGER